ncbi:MAG: hypothetical protein JRI72_08810 [Deltaproteobacteria bacterium]|nr:hypothetical protein [Deltaproteobacteria bacterium]
MMRIGIDIGGTFNDAILMYGGETHATNLVNSWPAEGTMATAFIANLIGSKVSSLKMSLMGVDTKPHRK